MKGETMSVDEYLTGIEICSNDFSENETDSRQSAAGGLHKYANPALINQEKDTWKKAAIKKHRELFAE